MSVFLSVIALDDLSAGAETKVLGLTVESANGRGRSVTPGRPCSDGGSGAYWHYDYGASLAVGAFSASAGEALVHLNLHSDTQDFQNVDGVYPGGADPTAFLQGAESHASLLNDRGSVKLRLESGSCSAPSLAFDGSTATGAGTWKVDAGAGAYRAVAGAGTFALVAEVNPGADNALNLKLAGKLDLPPPSLDVSVVRTYWGGLGTDYLTRRLSVVYRVTNPGPGDAFGVVITNVESLTAGVRALVALPIPIGDLREGESTEITMRHQISVLDGPCALVILGCDFKTKFTANLPDAFDAAHVQSDTVAAKAPLLPPPL